MIKVLVFDLDGTLVDTDEVLICNWHEIFDTFKPKGYKIDDETIRTFSGPPLKETIKKYLPEYDVDFIYNEFDKRVPKYYNTKLVFFDNYLEVLTKFKKDGYKLAILTSKNRKMTLYCLNLMKCLPLFDYIVTSSDLTRFKPDPEGLDKIRRYFGCKEEEMINIGDTEYDYYCGHNANVKTIIMTMEKRVFKSKLFPLAFVDSYNNLYKEVKNYDNK
jgi:pyrophosphatase PpaX